MRAECLIFFRATSESVGRSATFFGLACSACCMRGKRKGIVRRDRAEDKQGRSCDAAGSGKEGGDIRIGYIESC